MFNMDNRVLKKGVYDECEKAQMKKIKHLENAMSEAERAAHEDKNTTDMFDSHMMQLIRKRDMFAQQLELELANLKILHRVDQTIHHDKVEFGAVVFTDVQKVFVSIGLGKVIVDSDTYYAISLKVPFYQAMDGKRIGDAFDFREKTIKILDIF